MKVLRNVLLVLLVSLLYAPVASAQNGAVIVRGQDNWRDFFWDGEDLLVVVSTDLGFFCADEVDLFPYDWMELWRPDGSLKFHENGNFFTRVYQPATPDDFWGPDDDPCPFIESGPLVAEGITHFAYNDNGALGVNPNRKNVWGFNVSGMLYDIEGFCPDDDMVDLTIVRRWAWKKNCDSDCVTRRVFKGPQLDCP
jgi:hypothetical protein